MLGRCCGQPLATLTTAEIERFDGTAPGNCANALFLVSYRPLALGPNAGHSSDVYAVQGPKASTVEP